MADTPLLDSNGAPVALPDLVVTVRQTRTPKPDGTQELSTRIESNLLQVPGVWQTVAQILLLGLQGAIEADVRERLTAQSRLEMPTFAFHVPPVH